MTKQEYMTILKEKLSVFEEELAKEILDDYEGHFRAGQESGKSEQEICEELGNIEEIMEDLRQLYNPKQKNENSFNSTVNDVLHDAVHFANNFTNTIVKGIKTGLDYGKRTIYSERPKDGVVDADYIKESMQNCKEAIIDARFAEVNISESEDSQFHLEYRNYGSLKDKMFYHFTTEQKGDVYYGTLLREQGNSSLFSILSTPKIEIILKIPKEFRAVEIRTISGDIKVEDVRVEKGKFYSKSGDIEIIRTNSKILLVHTISGDVHVEGNIINCQVKSTSGDISFYSETNSEGTLQSCSGDVELKIKGNVITNVNTISGDVNLYSEGSLTGTVQATSGDIKVKMKGGYRAKVRTISGDINLYHQNEHRKNVRSGSYILGAGENQVEINSVSGDIFIQG